MKIVKVNVTSDASAAVAERTYIDLPRKYNVVFHNDMFTPVGFVICILEKIFDMSNETAVKFVMEVESKGKAVAGTYIKSIAETKMLLVNSLSEEKGYPLVLTIEEA